MPYRGTYVNGNPLKALPELGSNPINVTVNSNGSKTGVDVNGQDEIVNKETSGSLVYVGLAAPNTPSSQASWKILRYDKSAGELRYASGSTIYDQIWDDRAILIYS